MGEIKHCEKCHYLMELYKRTPETNRDYWLMTEIFVFLHGGDICKESKAKKIAPEEKPIGFWRY